jgi:L-galactose dehydrogenase
MRYQQLGKTELQVSALSFGASPLGGAFGPIDEAEGIRAVHAAVDLGINFVDVSPYYGQTRAETVLGRALKTVPRDRYYLSTKVGRYGPTEFDFSAERVTRSVDESLQRLGIETIDVILCHDIEFVPLGQVIEEAIPALRKVQEQGKVRYVGVSGLPLKIYREVLEKVELDVILSYCHYTLYDTTLAGLIPTLLERNIGVINAAPTGMGLLTEGGPPPWHGASEEMKRLCRQAAEYCRNQNTDVTQLALRFSLANRDIHTTLVGMPTEEIVRKNVKWAEGAPDPALLAEVQAMLAPIKDQTWPTGLPENS